MYPYRLLCYRTLDKHCFI